MSRIFMEKEEGEPTINLAFYKAKWKTQAYLENKGIGPNMVKNLNFIERIHYGFIDSENNSVIPDERYIVNTENGRVFDFVADSYSLMRLNWTNALQRGLVSNANSAFGVLQMSDSYNDPRLRYGEYMSNILRFYNNLYIPQIVGIKNITSYNDYVNSFFDFLTKEFKGDAVTMTRWNTSINSNVMNTGLAFSYANIDRDADSQKINQIVDHPSFGYFKNLCLNMGFSISHNFPNILVYELKSPATKSIRSSYGLYNTYFLFQDRFIKTYTLDLNLLFNYINLYYNKYVHANSQTKVVKVVWNGVCNKTVSEYIRLSVVPRDKRPYTDLQELELYCKLRNLEEGEPFSSQKVNDIYKKAKYFLKKVDKAEAMSYINNEYRDQVWNKDHGFHDLNQKLRGKTTTQAQRAETGPVSSPGGSGGSSY